MDKNTKYKEVGLQKNLKLVVSKVSGLFSGSANEVISKTLAVINTIAGADTRIGFYGRITGVGMLLGNVMVVDLNIPLMDSNINSVDESAFNRSVANALVREFGGVNVGYLSPNPVTVTPLSVKVDVESDNPITDVRNALTSIGTNVEISYR